MRRITTGIVATVTLVGHLGCAPSPTPSDSSPAEFREIANAQEIAVAQEIASAEDQRLPASEILLSALSGGESEERVRAALAMGRIQSPSYQEALAAATEDPDREVRASAFFALGQMGLAEGVEANPEALRAVREGLSQPDPEMLSLAVEAWGKLAPPEGAPVLLPLLTHPEAMVRAETVTALFRQRFAPVWRQQTSTPPELPDSAREALARALGDPAPEVRRAAAHAFSRYGESEAIEGLTRLLQDPDEWTRVFAARGLARSGEVDSEKESKEAIGASGTALVTAPLLAALKDPAPSVRSEVVRAMTALGLATHLPASLATDSSVQVRKSYVDGMGSLDSTDTLQALRELSQDPSTTVRAASLEALARRLGSAFKEDLTRYLNNDSWILRAQAARSLEHLDPVELPLLDAALADSDSRVKAAALEALEALPEDPALTERIASLLPSEDSAVRGTAVDALEQRRHEEKLPWLEATYESSPGVDWVEIRESVVRALAETDGSQDLLFQIAQDDPAVSVRSRARTTLETLGSKLPEESTGPPEPNTTGSEAEHGFRDQLLAKNPTVLLETSKGALEIEVFADRAPLHAASFVNLVDRGFYDGLIWHRVVPNFVIQGGDPHGNGWGGPGYSLRDEIHRYRFQRGSVGMPKAGKDTGGCQIFICHLPTPHLDGNYTIFGQVTSGLEVIDAIEVGDLIERATVKN
ncbi:MAG: HEAT repeat domain-containing protein [Deltaproteobacteria bacterium]|nr:HEAT repeat domain-containing protein [Deltaproteobacteria bacterium]